jgi:hypothetical protein
MVRNLLLNLLIFAPMFSSPDVDVVAAGPGFAVAQIIATIAAAGMQAHSQIQAGRAANRAAKYNAKVAMHAAWDERKRSEQEVQDRYRQRSILQGQQRAAVGGSGIAIESSTVGGVLESTAMLAELDVLRIKSNAERKAWGLETKAEQSLYEGRAAQRSGQLQGAGSLLSGAASAANAGRDQWGER